MSLFSAIQEFTFKARAILPVMSDSNISREKKREMLNSMVNDLTDDTFKHNFIADRIMTIINMQEEICKEYNDTDSQVSDILSWLPRMGKHLNRLEKEVKKHRKQYGLNL